MATRRRSPHGRPFCENADYVTFVRRALRGLARRARRDIDVLPLISAVQADLDLVAVDAIVGALNDGHSWQDVGDRLGVTRQAVHLRYAAQVVARQAQLDTAAANAEMAGTVAGPAVVLPVLVPVDLAADITSAPLRVAAAG